MANEKKLTPYFLAIGFFWFVIIIVVLLASLPYNPLTLPFKSKVTISTFLPQGWGFFTRNPREPQIFLYKRIDDKWVLQTLPNTYFALGANRRMRALGNEIHYLMDEIKEEDWIACKKKVLGCTLKKPLSIRNEYEDPLICGDVIIKLQEPVPWAWSKREVVMPYRLVRLKVVCTK